MLGLLVWGFWFVLVVYGFWFLFRAKTFQFLTLDDLALTWRLHKQLAGCEASRIHSLVVKKNVVVGFRCDCGFEFIQERLVTQTTHKYPDFRLPRLMPSRGNALPVTSGSS